MAGSRRSQVDAARLAAVALVGWVMSGRRMLSDAVADPDGPLAPLPPSDRARAQRLATSVLRHAARADRLIAPHLRKTPPPEVMNMLRLGVVEIFVEGTPPHAAVNAAVTLVSSGRRTTHLSGLANAVLRQAAATPVTDWADLPFQPLPMWVRGAVVKAWGNDVAAAIEAVQAAPPPLDLTPKDALGADALADRLGAEALPTGSLRLTAPGQVSALDGYNTGEWWVQDAAAALPARLLAAGPGERVLDLCAAPGGKTLQLAATGAQVTALDISGPRMARVSQNLARCGLTAETVVADALHWQPPEAFDAVLLDAPCSASGTIRRHPDLAFVKDGSEVPALLDLQARLIDRALGMVRPGGRLVFCTCSLLPAEGERQLAQALVRHPGLAVLPVEAPGIAPEWHAPQGGLRLRPDHWAARGGIDGFFMAALRVPG